MKKLLFLSLILLSGCVSNTAKFRAGYYYGFRDATIYATKFKYLEPKEYELVMKDALYDVKLSLLSNAIVEIEEEHRKELQK